MNLELTLFMKKTINLFRGATIAFLMAFVFIAGTSQVAYSQTTATSQATASSDASASAAASGNASANAAASASASASASSNASANANASAAATANANASTNANAASNASASATCDVRADLNEVFAGGSVTIEWETTGYSEVRINGEVVNGENGFKTYNNIQFNTTYELTATNGNSSCTSSVTVICLPKLIANDCKLDVTKVVDKTSAVVGDELTYTIVVKNVGTTDCTGTGVKIVDVLDPQVAFVRADLSSNLIPGYVSTPLYTSNNHTVQINGDTLTPNESGTIELVVRVLNPTQCGDFEVKNKAHATALELNNFGTWAESQLVKTTVDNDCVTTAARCVAFSADPTTVAPNSPTILTWRTENAARVAINNGPGVVAANGSTSVTPLVSTTYILTVFDADDKVVDTCEAPVIVSSDPIPVCKGFTATPDSFAFGGGTTTLQWEIEGATSVSITPTIGSVALNGSQDVFVNANTNFELTATDGNGDKVTCSAPVTIQPPVIDEPLTCADTVTFSASETAIQRGQNTNLTWNTTNIDTVSISEINATALSGVQTVSPNDTTTYVLTATRGSESVNCPVTVSVSTGGGGGGGSPSPRCELEISDSRISLGDTITLKWDTSRATEITITDDRGNVIITTNDLMSDDKEELFDGEIELTPTRDTTYTLLAERGSRDEECQVSVEIDNSVTLLQIRDQQPLVAGISLSEVPHTGFEAGPILTLTFYTLLMAWALYLAYLIVIRKNPTPVVVPVTKDSSPQISQSGVDLMESAQSVRPDAFVRASASATQAAYVPVNLPTGVPSIGREIDSDHSAPGKTVTNDMVAELENRAHSQKSLLSSDAVRYFMIATDGAEGINEALDQVISEAKSSYPLEDGWVVINESRMQNLCEACFANTKTPSVVDQITTVTPKGSGSLAEAITTGNVGAAYEMIGNKPMLSLADAAADLDALYRKRQGGSQVVSDLLETTTAELSNEKIKDIIEALTSAIDGTYTDESSAVKVAIMKAVKCLR